MKIDLGCGTKKREGFIGVDSHPFEGVDVVLNIGKDPWPWEEGTVEEIHCSHVVEHLIPSERIHFVNEAYRCLSKTGKATIIVPHWSSTRAYGDLTHAWPPVSEFWFYYLSKEWRTENAPHNFEYTCDFNATWGYGLVPAIQSRNQEFQQFALSFYKDAITDIICTLAPKK